MNTRTLLARVGTAAALTLAGLPGCGDPGTGGSGVPSSAAAPVDGTASSAANPPAATGGTAAQGALGAADIAALPTLTGVVQGVEPNAAPPRLTVGGQVFNAESAVVVGADGNPIALAALPTGARVIVRYQTAATAADPPRAVRVEVLGATSP